MRSNLPICFSLWCEALVSASTSFLHKRIEILETITDTWVSKNLLWNHHIKLKLSLPDNRTSNDIPMIPDNHVIVYTCRFQTKTPLMLFWVTPVPSELHRMSPDLMWQFATTKPSPTFLQNGEKSYFRFAEGPHYFPGDSILPAHFQQAFGGLAER